MKKYTVKQYQSEDFGIWNEFVANAKNATFLFHRDFMEYHSDRFHDFSLLIFDEKQNLKAILPANRVEETLFSHQGLTYGGLVLNQKTKLQEVIEMVNGLLFFLDKNEITKLHLKQIPSIYSDFPSDEVDYLSFILNAKIVRKDSLSVIDLHSNYKFSNSRKQEINKGIKNNLVIREEENFGEFWNQVLIPNLKQKYNTNPLHSLEEIMGLKAKFPNNIRQFNVYLNNKIIAGTTVFETKNVVHSQYISGNSETNALGSLDFLYSKLINEIFVHKKYFDLGPSNENQGQNINMGVQFWKEGFGARTIVQNFYEIETKNYSLLENVLL